MLLVLGWSAPKKLSGGRVHDMRKQEQMANVNASKSKSVTARELELYAGNVNSAVNMQDGKSEDGVQYYS